MPSKLTQNQAESSHFKSLVLAKNNGRITEEDAIKAAKENPCATVALLRNYIENVWAEKGIKTALLDPLANQLFSEEFKDRQ